MKKSENKSARQTDRNADALFGAILKLKTLDEARRFFRDLLTAKELVEFDQRWKVARMLAKRVSYTTIAQKTGMSSTTIARVHKWLKRGMGGYKLMLERSPEKH